MMIDSLQITGATECLFFPENKERTREDGIKAVAEIRHARARPQVNRLARAASYFSDTTAESGDLHGWVAHIHVRQHEKDAGLMDSWTAAMLGNVGNPGLWIKWEGMCGGHGKDGSGRAMVRKGRSTMIGTLGLENRLRDEILGRLKLIFLEVGA